MRHVTGSGGNELTGEARADALLRWHQADILLAAEYCKRAKVAHLAGDTVQAEYLRDRAEAVHKRVEEALC